MVPSSNWFLVYQTIICMRYYQALIAKLQISEEGTRVRCQHFDVLILESVHEKARHEEGLPQLEQLTIILQGLVTITRQQHSLGL